jgi:NAD-dependent dihydropyrimidine dehydrogenase PreA subunit
MLSPNIVEEAEGENLEQAARSAEAIFVIDDNECTRCAICVERCPSDALFFIRVGDAKGRAAAAGE